MVLVIGLILPGNLYGQAETLKFAWPDGASSKVHVRSEGRRVRTGKTITWDMSLDFTMQLKRINDRIVVSRNDYSGWKGKLPPSFGGGAERYVDMVPTLIVTEDGVFVGIEGHEAARKLMSDSVAQSGGLNPIEHNAFETLSSNASLEGMARAHWASLVFWQGVELDPEVSYEIRNVVPVPQLGGGEIELHGAAQFVKEAPCELTQNDWRCVHLHVESEGDKAQVRKLIQSVLQHADPSSPIVTALDAHVKMDIVVEKTTMLPQQLKKTRITNITISDKKWGIQNGSEEFSTTYTFNWLLAPGVSGSRASDPPKGSAPDFSNVTSQEAAMKLATEGKLVRILLFPAELGGADIPQNIVYVPPGIPEIQAQVTDKVIGLVQEGLDIKLRVMPEYKGKSLVPAKIHIKASHIEKRGNFEQTIEIW